MHDLDILVTGCTGLLGRHILYELIGMEEFSGNIFVMMRKGSNASLEQKLAGLLSSPSLPDRIKNAVIDHNQSQRIRPIHGDLCNPKDLSIAIKHTESGKRKIAVIHSAGSVNLATTIEARSEVYAYNHAGTMNLLSALQNRIDSFVHISTAYSIGQVSGIVDDDFKNLVRGTFRNPYEECKSVTENALIEIAKKEAWKLTIIRPSIICGRLYDSPLFFTSKFDVFYSWIKFFWQLSKMPSCEKIRIHATEESRMNIVPVDYVSRAVCAAWKNDIHLLNAVNPVPITTREGMSIALHKINFKNYEFVSEKPIDLNRWEQFYYASVGAIFGQYIVGSDIQYDTSQLVSIMPEIASPDIRPYIGGLIEFAAKYHFDDRKITK